MEDSKQNRARRDGHGRGSGGGRGGRGHGSRDGRGGRGGGKGGEHRERVTRPDDATSVPILRYGANTNFLKFKEKLSRAALKEYGDLGRLIEDMRYYEPPMIDEDDYHLDDDPRQVQIRLYTDAMRERLKSIREMRDDRSKLYAMIETYLSKESLDEIKQHRNYDTFHAEKDPLELWKAVTDTHRVISVSKVAAVMKQTAKDNFETCYQHSYETIVDFKQRYSEALDAYNNHGNPEVDS